MATLPMTFTRTQKKITVEIDADRLERLAGGLGLFSPPFLESLDRAEDDVRHGRVRKVKSLRALRKT